MQVQDYFIDYSNLKLDNELLQQSLLEYKEFYDLRLDKMDTVFYGEGLFKHQHMIKRLLSPYTNLNRLLIVHGVGTGKSCVSVAVVENMINYYKKVDPNSVPRKALVLMYGESLIDNYVKEIGQKCTSGKYLKAAGVKTYSKDKVKRAINKTYQIKTFSFLKHANELIEAKRFDEIKIRFSNRIIIIDEAHLISTNARKSAEEDNLLPHLKETIDFNFYNTLQTILDVAENTKLLLLTATPIIDKVDEIRPLLNLLISDPDQRLDKSITKFFNKENKLSDSAELKSKMRGVISYLKPRLPNVKTIVEGEIIPPLTKLKLINLECIDIQRNSVEENSTVTDDSNRSFDINSEYACLFAFPPINGKYLVGKDALAKYTSYKSPRVKYTITDYDLRADLQKNLRKYSSKASFLVENLKNNTASKHFAFCKYVDYGTQLMRAVLIVNGFTSYNGGNGGKNTIAILDDTSNKHLITETLKTFNSPDNDDGSLIRLIIASGKYSIGLSLRQVSHVYILTPHWNMSKMEQAIGRALRVDSHTPNSVVHIYNCCATLPNKETTDLKIYNTAERKDLQTQQIMRAMKEIAIDCPINYNRNAQGVDNSRDCNFSKCAYDCDQIDKKYKDEKNLEYVLPEDMIKSSNDNLLYHTTFVENIISQIKKKMDVDYEVRLSQILEKYSFKLRSPIMVFRIISEYLSRYKIQLNRYGLVSFVNEKNGVFFLSNKGTSTNPQTLYITDSVPYEHVVKRYGFMKDTKYLSEICSSGQSPENLVKNIIPKLGLYSQEELFESLFDNPKFHHLLTQQYSTVKAINNATVYNVFSSIKVPNTKIDDAKTNSYLRERTPSGKWRKFDVSQLKKTKLEVFQKPIGLDHFGLIDNNGTFKLFDDKNNPKVSKRETSGIACGTGFTTRNYTIAFIFAYAMKYVPPSTAKLSRDEMIVKIKKDINNIIKSATKAVEKAKTEKAEKFVLTTFVNKRIEFDALTDLEIQTLYNLVTITTDARCKIIKRYLHENSLLFNASGARLQ